MVDPNDVRDPNAVPYEIPGVTASTGSILRSVAPQPPQERQPMSVEEMRYNLAKQMYELNMRLPGAMMADKQAQMARAQAAAGRGYALDQQYRQAATAPLPPHYTPGYKDVPTQPPKFQMRDPAEAIVQPLSLLAAIGGLFARRAGTAAIRAMTGAMHGQRSGDQQNYENYMKEFDEQLKAAREYNQNEHQKYSDAWNDREKTLNERMAILQMLSTQYGNRAMGAAVGTGNAEMVQTQLLAMEGAMKALDKMAPKPQPGHELEHMKAEGLRLYTSDDPTEKAKGEKILEGVRKMSPALTAEERQQVAGAQARAKTGWANVGPILKHEIETGWSDDNPAVKDLHEKSYKLNTKDEGRLQNATKTLGMVENAANFVSRYPRAVGALAKIMNSVSAESLISPVRLTLLPENAEANTAFAGQVFDKVEERLAANANKMVGQTTPDGYTITASDASNALTYWKIVRTLALADAASLSTNGQGGTVYLDRVMAGIFDPNVSPRTMLRIMAERSIESTDQWRALGLEWNERKDAGKYPFSTTIEKDREGINRYAPQYEERIQFNQYRDQPVTPAQIGKDQFLSPSVKQALIWRDQYPTKEALQGLFQQLQARAQAGQLSDEQFKLGKAAIAVLLRQKFGVQ